MSISSITRLLVLVSLVALGGCSLHRGSPEVEADVSAFSELTPADKGKTFTVKAFDAAQEDSLEWRAYAALLAERMTGAGFKQAAHPDQVDSIARMDFGIDRGTIIHHHRSRGRYGFRSFGGFGLGFGRRHFRVNGFFPFVLPVYHGHRTHAVSSVVFDRSLAIDIVERVSGKKKWELSLASTGSCGRYATLAPLFFDAAFADFPENSGGAISLPLEKGC